MFQYNNSSSGFTSLADGNTDVFFGTKSDAGSMSGLVRRIAEYDNGKSSSRIAHGSGG